MKRAKIFCFDFFKGGTSKTTAALEIGTGLAQRGFRVLLADLDPQGNLSDSLRAEDGLAGSYEVLEKGAAITACAAHREGFDLLQSNPKLIEINRKQGARNDLKKALEAVRADYDFILIDCPPAVTPITLAALDASDKVIVPVEASPFCVELLPEFLAVITPEKVGGILISLRRRTNVQDQCDKAIRILAKRAGVPVLKAEVRQCTKILEAQAKRVSIWEYAKSSNAAQDYSAVIDELLKVVK
jgi:chromosome partitioning protein